MPDKNTIPVIEATNPPKWTVDISKWRMRQIEAWQTAAANADIQVMNSLLLDTPVVNAVGEQIDSDILGEMSFPEWSELTKAVAKKLGDMFRSA